MPSEPNAADPSPQLAIPIRPAATVLLIRDGDGGPEVCLLRRNLESAFVGGAYLFPGGGVDALDGTAAMAELCDGGPEPTDDGEDPSVTAVHAHWVAALREAFEECGLLCARHAGSGEPLTFDDPQIAARFAAHREAVDSRERTLAEVLVEEELRLDLRAMHPVAHWVTPAGAPRRYDTHFYVAPAPAGQPLRSDDREVIAALWVRPEDALTQHAEGAYSMLPPTVESLRWLGSFGTVRDALEAAAAITEIPRIVPRVLTGLDGSRQIVLPTDPGYDEAYDGEGPLDRWRP